MENNILIKLHTLMRNDPYVKSIAEAIEKELLLISDSLIDIDNQMWFEKITWMINKELDDLGIELQSNSDINNMRSIIEARWKNNGKSDIKLLQSIANSWDENSINVKFTNGNIQIEFLDGYGSPIYISDFEKELERAKPAHLPILFLYRYLLIESIHEQMSIGDIEKLTLDKFEF